MPFIKKDEKLTQVDLLIYQKKIQQSNHEKKIIEEHDSLLQECTFKPDLISNKTIEVKRIKGLEQKNHRSYITWPSQNLRKKIRIKQIQNMKKIARNALSSPISNLKQ